MKVAATALDRLFRLVLSLAVSISILQLPVPVAHIHAEMASADQLLVHLDRHHQQQNTVHDDEVHWHLALPGGDEDSDEPRPSPPSAANSHGLATGVTPSFAAAINWLETGDFPLRSADLQSQLVVLRLERSTGIKAGGLIPPSKRLCAVLCVIRC